MSNKEKLPKLVDVYRLPTPLDRRQLPLVVDENLTLVMDIKNSGVICDNQTLRGKELEEFSRKWNVLSQLSEEELKSALQITKSELMHVLNQNVPCVGCRRSVDRLYYQLFKFGHPTLDPIRVKPDGTITIREDKLSYQIVGSIFQNHSSRLAKLIETQPKRNKKSVRCLLHSLDSQRNRPLTPAWRDVWDCMKLDCKKDVCIIEASTLHATLETYLRKHRFCGECRTKVLKAYSLLMEDPEPGKEKGYVSSLYSGIKRCLPDKHIHLQTKTDYVTRLIDRAEPELLGSRRERHAKTLEIAQEEVLTCLGICMYERLHRIYMRMREEECTCRVFAAVAVHTLSRSFETAVEKIRGVSRLEVLYAEIIREEQQKQMRKEQKKIRRRRKKGKSSDQDCPRDDEDKDCSCSSSNSSAKNDLTISCYDCDEYQTQSVDIEENDHHRCVDEYDVEEKGKKDKRSCSNDESWPEECKWENDKRINNAFGCKCDNRAIPFYSEYTASAGTNNNSKKETNGSNSDHSHDCGYSSENNNGCCETVSLVSSLSSSPDGSELACNESCCQHDNSEPVNMTMPHCRLSYGGGNGQLSLQEMLESHSEEDDDDECYITPEEVREFEINNSQVLEKRQALRETLQKRFVQFCVNGPRLLVQTKYASN